jgi:hypothetical protein
MTKPILIIKLPRLYFLSKRDEILRTLKGIFELISKEYYVISIPDDFDVSVLNGLSYEMSEEQIKELQQKLDEAIKEM